MAFLDYVYQNINFDRDLVFRFFVKFSLFEHALKNVGFSVGNSSQVTANWRGYANFVNEHNILDSTAETRNAIEYIISNPPLKQIKELGAVFFRESICTFPNEAENLFVYIRRVRNNLFHGGKLPYDYGRDTKLINCCMVILDNLAENDQLIKNNINLLLR